MKRKYPLFTAEELTRRINDYFVYIRGEYHYEETAAAGKKTAARRNVVWDREPEPATISGLAHFLGFSSHQAFTVYQQKGKHAHILEQGVLRVEHEYEKKLHQQSTGVIFALKCLGWGDKNEGIATAARSHKTLNVKIHESGPAPVSSEKEVTAD